MYAGLHLLPRAPGPAAASTSSQRLLHQIRRENRQRCTRVFTSSRGPPDQRQPLPPPRGCCTNSAGKPPTMYAGLHLLPRAPGPAAASTSSQRLLHLIRRENRQRCTRVFTSSRGPPDQRQPLPPPRGCRAFQIFRVRRAGSPRNRAKRGSPGSCIRRSVHYVLIKTLFGSRPPPWGPDNRDGAILLPASSQFFGRFPARRCATGPTSSLGLFELAATPTSSLGLPHPSPFMISIGRRMIAADCRASGLVHAACAGGPARKHPLRIRESVPGPSGCPRT